MTNRKSEKYQLTETLVSLLAARGTPLEFTTIEQLLPSIWMTGRAGQGLRLTDKGMNSFLLAGIAHYDYPVGYKKDYPINRLTVDLGRKVRCPYHLWLKKEDKGSASYIRIYDHKIAMMISIYGTFLEYLASIR